MADFMRPPTRDEMQYAGDVIRGKRPVDVRIIIAAAILGAILGVAVGVAGNTANDEPLDPGFIAMCAVVFAAAFAVIAGLVLSSVRSMKAVCEAWLPARVIVAVAGVLLFLRIAQNVSFAFLMDRSSLGSQLAMDALLLVFAVLFLNLGVRLIFIVYCMITGRDEDEIVTRNISADHEAQEKEPKGTG